MYSSPTTNSISWLKTLLITIVILGFIGGLSYQFRGKQILPPTNVKTIEVHKVTKGNLVNKERLIGTVKAKQLYNVSISSDGTLRYVAMAGTKLKMGEIIAQVANDELENALVVSSKAYQLADEQYKRAMQLAATGAISKQRSEDLYTQLVEARKRLNNAKIERDHSVAIAPFDGVVGVAQKLPGAFVKNGEEIVVFYNPAELMVEFAIPAAIAKGLHDGQLVTINSQDVPIAYIQKALAAGTYTIPATVSYKCDNCIVGENINVDLHLTEVKDAIIVPSSVVFLNNGRYAVYRVQGGKMIELVEVEVGIMNTSLVQITNGVNVGDDLVLKGQNRLYPGIEVVVHSK